jgi:quercetin dioxygenase-like cupin family protein
MSLANIYETPLQALLDPAAAVASAESTVIRGTRATIQRGNGLRYRPISGGKDALRLSALHVTVPRRRKHRTFSQHDGEELLYVLSGTLVLTLDRQSHTLGAGDSAHFDSKIPHRLTAADDRDAEVLLVSCTASRVGHQGLQPAKARKRTARPAHDRNGGLVELCALPTDENFGRNFVKV